MSDPPRPEDALDLRRRVDAACWRFEQAWKAATDTAARPLLEEWLGSAPDAEQPLLLRELLLIELEYRRQRGETLTPQGYYERFPAHTALIDEVFASLTAQDKRLTGPEAAAILPQAGAGPAKAPEVPPTHFGRYRVIDKLGEGGFGVVYRASDESLHREVAIKVPAASRWTSESHVEEYLREARLLANLKHAGIVPVYDFGRTENGACYLVSEYLPGSDLRNRMRERRFPPREAVELTAQVAEALHHAHQRGLIHRDVKPANILLDAQGRPVVADFGLALRDEEYGTGPHYAGTPAYMSPEQAKGEGHRVDPRTDIYSLGVVFYEMLTGHRPYRGDTRSKLFQEIRHSDLRPPRQLDDAIPRELDRICLKALSKRAADRYSTALDFAEDLRHWLTEAPLPAPAPPAQPVNVHVVMPPPSASTHSAAPSVGPPSAATPPPPSPTPSAASDTDPNAVRVVPKGLRSFDRKDADFFLDLLPGPRDRLGMPESLRFWKTRIEETDPNATFTVGLLYGPSGCGKSSLVKAGLLPRLAPQVTVIYLEATPHETEAQIGTALRRAFPGLPPVASLSDQLAQLRRGQGLDEGKKVLLILDQFEQWLHARDPEADSELVEALRQCDGKHVQALLLVRDDFWMAATRFLRELEVPLVEGRNAAAADLFTPQHARRVLAKFGLAYGCLPEDSAQRTSEQEAFLDRAVAELGQDGKIIPIRLSLFAEMVKGRPWKPTTLVELGGAEGVAAAFLDETFSPSSAPLPHRAHERAARAVLESLLPEPGSPLRGAKRTRGELLHASGYARRPREFIELLALLDTELRLVTPTETADEAPAPHAQTYQLTHDYLVPALRDWLTRKQRQTRRGRALLVLTERAALWNTRRENRQLPTWWEWVRITLLTRRRERTEPQRVMMRKATRYHLLRSGLAVLLLLTLSWLGRAELDRRHELERRNRVQAEAIVERLLGLRTSKTPELIAALASYERWATPSLLMIFDSPLRSPRDRLHAGMALLGTQRAHVEGYLSNALLELEPKEPDDFVVLRKELLGSGADDAKRITQHWQQELVSQEIGRSVRAAVALLQAGEPEAAWKMLEHDRDPTARTALLHAFARLGTDAELLVGRLQTESDPRVRPALLLAVGEYGEDQLPAARRRALVESHLLKHYTDPDPGVHAAAEWVLRRWAHAPDPHKAAGASEASALQRERGWFVTRSGQTMVAIRGPVEFDMGSPAAEPGRIDHEVQHRVRIERSFALADKEVTLREFEQHLAAARLTSEGLDLARKHSRPDGPMLGISWLDAALYCQWLSEREGVPPDQYCYPSLSRVRELHKRGEFLTGFRLEKDYLQRTGYRLPTEAEWEYACRAGATTSRAFGKTAEFLGQYARYVHDSEERAQAVGWKKPNDFGFFDLYGNAQEWTNSLPLLAKTGAVRVDDEEVDLTLKFAPAFIMKGGGYFSPASYLRSAHRTRVATISTDSLAGFRIARTLQSRKELRR